MNQYSWSYNEHTSELTIYSGNRTLATISKVAKSKCQEIFEEVVFEVSHEAMDNLL